MKVVLYDNLPDQLKGRVNCHLASNPPQEWWDLLTKVSGMTLEVDTTYLFQDQFNTHPIPGISETGIRVLAWLVKEVVDDVRPLHARCKQCGKATSLAILGAASTCPKCQADGCMEVFVKDPALCGFRDGRKYILAVP